jgi:hypothetical protein
LLEWQTLGPLERGCLKGLAPNFDKQAERIIEELAAGEKLEILQLRTGLQLGPLLG